MSSSPTHNGSADILRLAIAQALGGANSGVLLTAYGWSAVCWVVLPPLLIAAGSLTLTRSFVPRLSA